MNYVNVLFNLEILFFKMCFKRFELNMVICYCVRFLVIFNVVDFNKGYKLFK